jgi:hypothetical protein
MKKRIQPAVLLLTAVCATTFVATKVRGTEFKMESHERGQIESVELSGNTLTVKDVHSKDTRAFTWNDKTAFQKREHVLGKSQTVTAGDLKAGEHVNVEFYKDGDQLVAKKIIINHENKDAGTATQPNPN